MHILIVEKYGGRLFRHLTSSLLTVIRHADMWAGGILTFGRFTIGHFKVFSCYAPIMPGIIGC